MMKQFYLFVFSIAYFCANGQNLILPDPVFKNALVSTLCVDLNYDDIPDADADNDNDGEIQQSEADAIISLILGNRNLTSVTGIGQFVNLEVLDVSSNQLSGELDLTALSVLRSLYCDHNSLTRLLLPDSDLSQLNCSYNQIAQIDIQQYELFNLNVAYNQLTSFDLTDAQANGQLLYLDISGNLYTDVGAFETMGFYESDVIVNDTKLLSLDLSQCDFVFHLEIRNNSDLETINFQNNDLDVPCSSQPNPETPCHIQSIIENNPSLTSICVDANEADAFAIHFDDPLLLIATDCALLTTTDFESDADFVIFPNPATNVLNIESEAEIPTQAKIYDIFGQLPLTLDHPSQIEIGSLPAGVYVIELISNEKKTNRKFIKL